MAVLLSLFLLATGFKSIESHGACSPHVNCGLKCVSFLHWVHLSPVTLAEIEKEATEVVSSTCAELSVASLVETARRTGLELVPRLVRFDDLTRLDGYHILWLPKEHFVVLSAAPGECVQIYDPGLRAEVLPRDEFGPLAFTSLPNGETGFVLLYAKSIDTHSNSGSPRTDTSSGKLKIHLNDIPIGIVEAGTQHKVSFAFLNHTPRTMHFVSTKDSCGWSDVRLSEDRLDPGQVGFCMSTANVPSSASGALKLASTLVWRDEQGEEAEVELRVQMFAKLVVSVDPETLEFDVRKESPPQTQTVTLGGWE